jgi:hypothetical protein
MPLQDFFSFGSRKPREFDNWPLIPDLKSGLVSHSGLREFESLLSPQQDGRELSASVIVAIGKTGEETLSLLFQKLLQGNVEIDKSLKAVLITDTSSFLPDILGRKVRVIELQKAAATLYGPRILSRSERFPPLLAFQQVINYKKYQEWLQESLADLNSGAQVFFVGSLSEASIGILGDALQILRAIPKNLGRSNLLLRVCAFLALGSVTKSGLSSSEVFAASRELGRMTFSGPHSMNTSYGTEAVVRSALLDHFFILDTALPYAISEKKEINIAQNLAEILFSLLHPSANFLWENLLNDIKQSAGIRTKSSHAVIHSAGVATSYIPLQKIKRYIGLRLAFAALLGERKSKQEGLVARIEKPGVTQVSMVRNQFLSTRTPFYHPVFDWILRANDSNYFSEVPDLAPQDFIPLFQLHLSHNLLKYLNEIPATLEKAEQELLKLDSHLINCEDYFKHSNPRQPNAVERLNFEYILSKWRETVKSLITDLADWQKNIWGGPENDFPGNQVSSMAGISATTDWRTEPVSKKSGGWREGGKETTESSRLPGACGLLQQWRQDVEAELSAANTDRIYRSVAADSQGDLVQLETYYTDTVRPELSAQGRNDSPNFTRIQERLQWWIEVIPDKTPKLYLLCWHSSFKQVIDPPPQDVRFRPEQFESLVSRLLDLALLQTERVEADLTGEWFPKRVTMNADFLRRAEDVYLDYDHNWAAKFSEAAKRRSYLITNSPGLSRNIVYDIFPNTPRLEINELTDGEKARCTALTLRVNIPVGSIVKLRDFRQTYSESAADAIHLYPQERTAALYERRIWKLQREKILITPEIAVLLANHQLVTLFFQSLFVGVIRQERSANDRLIWQVDALDDFPSLELADAGETGLLQAFRNFVLDLPQDESVNQNPKNHFHPDRMRHYLAALTEKTKRFRVNADVSSAEKQISDHITYWQNLAQGDENARSFYVLIVCERDEPVWNGW